MTEPTRTNLNRHAEYADWIAAYVAQHAGHVGGLCSFAAAKMVDAFPELRRVRGHYYSHDVGTAHWWCVAPDGSVVDPTAKQFEHRSGGHYIEYTGPEPLGLCFWCRAPIWHAWNGRTDVCSAECYECALAELKD